MVTLRTMANQERISQITNKWNQLLAKAEQFLLPIVDALLGGALAITDWVPAIMAFINPLGQAVKYTFGWIASGEKILSIFDSIGSAIMKLGKPFDSIARIVLRIGGVMAKFGEAIAKVFGIEERSILRQGIG